MKEGFRRFHINRVKINVITVQQTAFSHEHEENQEPVNYNMDDQREDEETLGIDAIRN